MDRLTSASAAATSRLAPTSTFAAMASRKAGVSFDGRPSLRALVAAFFRRPVFFAATSTLYARSARAISMCADSISDTARGPLRIAAATPGRVPSR